jgi:hypothetical protein
MGYCCGILLVILGRGAVFLIGSFAILVFFGFGFISRRSSIGIFMRRTGMRFFRTFILIKPKFTATTIRAFSKDMLALFHVAFVRIMITCTPPGRTIRI